VTDVEDGVRIVVDPVHYSEGAMTIRSVATEWIYERLPLPALAAWAAVIVLLAAVLRYVSRR
jgi:hypothetical protein